MSPRTLALAAGAAVIAVGAVVLLVHASDSAGTRPAEAPAAATATRDPAARTSRSAAITARAPAEQPQPDVTPATAPHPPQLNADALAKLHRQPLVGGGTTAEAAPRPTLDSAVAAPVAKEDRAPTADPDYEATRTRAVAALAKNPGDVATARALVEAACTAGDKTTAARYHAKLPDRFAAEVRRGCEAKGIALPDDHAWTTGEVHPTSDGLVTGPAPDPRPTPGK